MNNDDNVDGALRRLVSFLDEGTKFTFRKVCRRFKAAVDGEKRKYTVISISILLNQIQLTFKNERGVGFRLNFCKNPLGCVIEQRYVTSNPDAEGMLIEIPRRGLDYIETALAEFRTHVTHPDTEIAKLEVSILRNTSDYSRIVRFFRDKRRFLERIEEDLRAMGRYVKVGAFWMQYIGMEIHEREVLAFLPYFELIGEKVLHLRPSLDANRPLIALDIISQLDQWRAARRLIMKRTFWTRLSFEHWMHFERCKIVVAFFPTHWAKALIRHYLASPTFVSCIIDSLNPNLAINLLYEDIYEFQQCPQVTVPPMYSWIIPNSNGFKVSILGNTYFFQAPNRT